jgi:regulatory protein
VARDLGDKAIAEVFEDEGVDESANIDRVARKKMKTLANLDALTQRRRLYAFLARRGYDVDAIGKVVGRLAGRDARAE